MARKVLVVEDNELNLRLFCDLLRAHDCHVEGVRDGREGRERGPVMISEVAAKLGERFDKMDANRDGVISPDERRAAMTAHRADRQARRAERQAARPASQAASPAPASE